MTAWDWVCIAVMAPLVICMWFGLGLIVVGLLQAMGDCWRWPR